MTVDPSDPGRREPDAPAGWFVEAPSARRTTPAGSSAPTVTPKRRRQSATRRRRLRYALPLLATGIVAGLIVAPRIASGGTPAQDQAQGQAQGQAQSPAPGVTPTPTLTLTPTPTPTPLSTPLPTPTAAPTAVVRAGVTLSPAPTHAPPPTGAPTGVAPTAERTPTAPSTPVKAPPKPPRPHHASGGATGAPVTDHGAKPPGVGPVKGRVAAPDVARKRATTTHAHGFRIHRTGRAAGSWIGAYRLDGVLVYRIRPQARPAEGRYRGEHAVADLSGKAKPSRTATAEAAYVLSQYGALRKATSKPTQAAAVDTAVYALLDGWKVSGTHARSRLRQSGHTATVAAWARDMLADAKATAGSWQGRLTVTDATVGQDATLTFSLRNHRTRKTLPGTTVTFTYAGTIRRATIGSDGTASTFVTVVAGTHPATANVAGLPDWRLHVRRPAGGHRSPVAIAGRTAGVRVAASLVGFAPVTTSVTNGAPTSLTHAPLAGTFTVTGTHGPTQVLVRLWGPAHGANGSAPTTSLCDSGTPRGSRTVTVDADGSYPVPTYTPITVGYYSWQAGDSCGAPVQVRSVSATTQARIGTTTNALKKSFGVKVTVSGFGTAGETHQVVTRLYGPFDSASRESCSGSASVIKTFTHNLTAAGSWQVTTAIKEKKHAGYYVWRTAMPSGALVGASASSCGIAVHVTK